MSGRQYHRQRVGALSPEQRALLDLRSRKKGLRLPGDSGIPRRPPGSGHPLSIDQERLWFIDRLTPGMTAYNIHLSCLLLGPIDITALERSLEEIVRRHESLRTTIVEVGGRPVAVVHEPTTFPLLVEDLSALSSPTREQERLLCLFRLANRPFDLEKGPLVRAAVVRTGPREHALLVTVHHIITDRVSMTVLEREIAILYTTFKEGRGSSLPELPIQFADFAAWQRRHLQGKVLAGLETYWTLQLEGAPFVLSLPTDHPRSEAQRFTGVRHPFSLSEGLGQELRALARAEGVTPFMLYTAAFGVLLQRYAGQDEVLIGTPIADRTQPETRSMIGYLLNMLPVRVDLRGNPSFRQLLARVRSASLGLYSHRDLPFGKLVELLNVPRDLSRNPIFQVSLVYLETSAPPFELPGLSVAPMVPQVSGSRFDLTLAILDSHEKTGGFVEYRTDLWEEATVGRMLAHLEELLQGALRGPTQAIRALPMLKAGEEQQILNEWNATAREYRQEVTVHGLFEAEARRSPARVALSFEGDELTYGALDWRANQLARRLRSAGVGPDVLVAIVLERSIDVVVALLAILKAGGAYVPVDPAYPPERLAFMVEDAGAQVLLTQKSLRHAVPFRGSQVLCVDDRPESLVQESEAPLPSQASADNLAYVIYTSGSTGRPKGVQVPHRSLVNLLAGMAERPGIEPDDVLLSVTTLSFDMAALDVFLPLSRGGRLEIASRTAATNGHLLADRLMKSGATVMHATPSTWRMLLDAGWSGGPLKAWSGGEALSGELAEQLLRKGVTLWNLYGPTETSVVSAVQQVESAQPVAPIGRPIGNATLYVLDSRCEPVPIGVPGELFIGGGGVTRGYRNRPDLTAEHFLPDPFGRHPGGRLYRTGDLVRYRADGTVDFLGRLDHQVKVRGFRIELGEIEAVLRSHPGVSNALVVVREDRPGDKRLVSYVVWTESGPVVELLRWVRRKLPSYMVPSAIVPIERLPLTPNGKVDRRGLPAPGTREDRRRVPAPEAASGLEAVEVTRPPTPIEELLVDIWKEVLGLERVAVDDSFFELGGHSLHVTQVISRVRETLGVELTIPSLFEATTVAEQALVVIPQLVARHGEEDAARMIAELAKHSSMPAVGGGMRLGAGTADG